MMKGKEKTVRKTEFPPEGRREPVLLSNIEYNEPTTNRE